ncbi:hypothetical protein [Chitinilyticum aquatile]|uniref:hypothetical protein n=1 Tax=Chitinilyticum aquatile TaxID=362520 RepID=UPI0003FC1D96|nr:hypothetical protein [Chitinilyticum aquatile]
MKNEALSTDELEALVEVGRGLRSKRLSPRVFKHAKVLSGLKYAEYARNGILTITEKGRQTLFLKRCIDGLRLLTRDPLGKVDPEALTFLLKKGHVSEREEGGYSVTAKGAESLADIDARR